MKNLIELTDSVKKYYDEHLGAPQQETAMYAISALENFIKNSTDDVEKVEAEKLLELFQKHLSTL